MALYDSLGRGYVALRREDSRIAAALHLALGAATSVVNVGAGAGSYESCAPRVVAVEPSVVMLHQRPQGSAPAVRGVAARLPFADDAFDASLAILTVHHWPDLEAGLCELRRVARDRVLLLTFDPGHDGFWLLDYLPEIREIDRRSMPSLERLERHLGPCEVRALPVPHDCSDGFLGAYWRRPEAYLDSDVRRGISVFSKMRHLEAGLDALARDLASGAWARRYAGLEGLDALDLGYRIVVATV